MSRRLLTILAADIAGYSSHVEADEEQAVRHLTALRQLMDSVIEAHGGRIANSAGDSVLAWFESPVQALRASIRFQEAHRVYNANLPPNHRMMYRVGVNIGDISVQPGGDLLGHGVNIAARLEALAEPGGICLSSTVMDQVEGKFDFAFSKVGEHRVKNISKPILVFSVGGAVKTPSLLRRRITEILKHPGLSLSVALLVALFSGATAWYVLRRSEVQATTPELAALLRSNPSSEDILASFDLVTTDSFQGHTYHIIRTWGGTWADVQALSNALRGYPVAIGTPEENAFLFELSLRDEGHWKRYGTAHEGPLIGLVQDEGADEPDGGWRWENGEPVNYSNWATGSPDNYRGNQNLATFANPRSEVPSPTWGDTPAIHNSIVIEVPD